MKNIALGLLLSSLMYCPSLAQSSQDAAVQFYVQCTNQCASVRKSKWDAGLAEATRKKAKIFDPGNIFKEEAQCRADCFKTAESMKTPQNGGDCDFDKPSGSCTANIEIARSGGSAPSFSAELKISSSAPRCSRVEYYINSTPYLTVLKNTSEAMESTFGTKPITMKDISIDKCLTFQTK